MIVQDPAPKSFEEYIAANTRFWSQRLATRPPHSRRYILVDLLHNNGSVLILNLLLARYLGELLGLDVAAFVGPQFTGYPVPVEQVKQLARSFRVTTIHHIDNAYNPDTAGMSVSQRVRGALRHVSFERRLTRVRRRLRARSGAALRREVLDLEMGEVPVGPLVYDSYLDVARRATIEEYNDQLDVTIARALRISDDFDRILSTGDVGALIVSHPVYVDYGVPMRQCLKYGVPVYGKVWLDPIGVRRYQRLDEAAEFAGMPVAPAIDYFRKRLGPKLVERAGGYFPPRPQKQMNLDYFKYGYGGDKTEKTKEEISALLGIDPAKKTALIMAHQFTDAPHCYPDMIFDDYYQWLDETLAFATSHPEINWLVRQHPYEIMVGETEFFDSIAARWLGEGSPLKLVPNSVTTSSLFGVTDVVVTVISSGGIEFASIGVPCILAGSVFYGDFDFATRPPTKEAYFAALADISSATRLSDQQIEAAKELALVFLSYKRVSSDRVPFLSDLAGRTITQNDIDDYWRAAATLLTEKRLEDDPLYVNLGQMIRENHTTLMNFTIE